MSQADFTNSTSDIDCYNVPEYFCEALAKVEQVGPVRRLVFVIHNTMNGRRERVGVVKLALPADALADIAQMLAADVRTPAALASLSLSALAN